VHPKYAPAYYYKALHYIQQMFPARALHMLQKARSLAEMDVEAEDQMSQMETVATELLTDSAKQLGVPIETMKRASLCNEIAQEKLALGQWMAAEQQTREALRLIPHWISPRNNRSFVLYYAGKIQEAIAEAKKVLEVELGNFHALKNLIIFHVGLNEEEKALGYVAAIKREINSSNNVKMEIDIAIFALGLVNDHEALWDLAQKFIKRGDEELQDVSWYALGVAALHFDKRREAQKLLEKVEAYYDPARELAIDVRKAIKTKTKLSTPSFYSTSLGTLLPHAILKDIIEILSKHKGDGELPAYLRKKLDEYLQPRPFVINALLRMLPDPLAAQGVPGILLSLNRSDVDARLLEFALGDKGDDNIRLNVLSTMAQEGRGLPPNPIRFWSVELGEWHEVDFSGQMLTDEVDLNISEEAAHWVTKAQQTDDIKEKISFLRKAVQVDPQSGYAVHMLGIHLITDGQKEEGRRLARKALEVDPEYMFAYANLSLLEAQEEEPNVELAQSYIAKVLSAPIITEQTAFLAHVASMFLAFDQKDFVSAKREFEIASELRPDDPMLEGWDARLNLAEVFSGGWIEKYQRDSRERTHKKVMGTKLEAYATSTMTLNSLTREVLGSVARIWGVPSYGKKAVLVENIANRMLDKTALEHVMGKLSTDEKNALTWVLENDGVRSFQSFSEKWGNDLEESPFWNYHEPKTVMGRLRQSALLAKGTLNNEQVVCIPADVRTILKTL
ncbi:MAG: hypothetical protein HYU84_10960, partial [Chloroflexi bacterium]|nr:hypothetical protein [Chloroflexota bacterium]